MPGKSKRIPRLCEQCSTPFMAFAYVMKRGFGRFCSRQCSSESQKSSVEDALKNYSVHPVTGCWEYQGAKDGKGYAVLGYTKEGRHTYIRLSRAVLERHHGVDISDTKVFALHTCDNPPCIRYDHIFPGSGSENSADMKAKGRQARGERHASRTHPETRPRGEAHTSAKLTDAQVREIRERYAAGDIRQIDLANEYGVPQTNVSRIVRHETWKHVV